MCVHNGLSWNCSACCYPSVQNTCTPVACSPVSPWAVAPAPTVPSNIVYTQSAAIVLDPTKLYAAPLQKYTIVAAQGSGSVIEVLHVRALLKVVTAPSTPVAYDDGLGSPPVVNITMGSTTLFSDSTILGSITDKSAFYSLPSGLISNTFDNQALEIGTSVLPAAGNSTLYIRVIYAVRPL